MSKGFLKFCKFILNLRSKEEFHISHDASRLISVFSPRRRKERSKVLNKGDFQRPKLQYVAHPR